MADIKQAAKWMREGKGVRRSPWKVVYDAHPPIGSFAFVKWDGHAAGFTIEDLLADDWEIAE